jgi:hypothetical protein
MDIPGMPIRPEFRPLYPPKSASAEEWPDHAGMIAAAGPESVAALSHLIDAPRKYEVDDDCRRPAPLGQASRKMVAGKNSGIPKPTIL